MSIEIKTCI